MGLGRVRENWSNLAGRFWIPSFRFSFPGTSWFTWHLSHSPAQKQRSGLQKGTGASSPERFALRAGPEGGFVFSACLSSFNHSLTLSFPPSHVFLSFKLSSNFYQLILKNQHSHSLLFSRTDYISGPITSWQIDVETMETVREFIFLGSKITADGDCSHQIKRPLLLERKAMANLDIILKIRDIILPTKVWLVKAMVFPVVMYGCESWTIKKVSTKEFVLLNYGAGEDSWESLGLQGDSTSPS